MVHDNDIPEGGTVRAVICDIYGTLLQIGPPPVDAGERWKRGCQEIAGHFLTMGEFDARCSRAVAHQHAARRASGEPFPEVHWLAIVRTAIPGLDEEHALQLSSVHAACSRTCTEMPDAIRALDSLHTAGILTGIASNAQHYTRDDLTAAGFSLTDFHPQLCFLSGDHGFAKPSPRVFSLITERLANLGIEPHETLMIGDNETNDIAPARAAGWQTCLVEEGLWESVRAALT